MERSDAPFVPIAVTIDRFELRTRSGMYLLALSNGRRYAGSVETRFDKQSEILPAPLRPVRYPQQRYPAIRRLNALVYRDDEVQPVLPMRKTAFHKPSMLQALLLDIQRTTFSNAFFR